MTAHRPSNCTLMLVNTRCGAGSRARFYLEAHLTRPCSGGYPTAMQEAAASCRPLRFVGQITNGDKRKGEENIYVVKEARGEEEDQHENAIADGAHG